MPFDARPETCASAAMGARLRCEFCPSASRCLVQGCAREELANWNAAVSSQVALSAAGRMLVEAGAPVQAIFVVRAGCLKSYTLDEQGQERVRAFYLPGDVIGLDALGAERHPAHVAAVTASQVCRLALDDLRRLLARSPALMQRLMERMSHDLAAAQALSGNYTAEQRVAAFLVSMEQRLNASNTLKLPMPRRDIASYLRLATETVCRVLTRFEESGRITSDNKVVRMLDAAGLRGLAEPMATPQLRAA